MDIQCIQLSDIKLLKIQNDEYRMRNPRSGFHHSAFNIHHSIQFSGDIVGRVTPVPIPNTEVKPTGADDTAAFSCGKVGSRRI